VASLRNRIAERGASMAVPGSWPNWRYYFLHSKVIESLWTRPNQVAREIFISILGWDPFLKSSRDYVGPQLLLFLRLLTQKLWLDQRVG
jgi:hypothetical protein